jgi:hypothetical protein
MPEMSWMPYLYISFAICPVINSTYIYLRDRGSYIYVQEENIQKIHWRNIIIERLIHI